MDTSSVTSKSSTRSSPTTPSDEILIFHKSTTDGSSASSTPSRPSTHFESYLSLSYPLFSGFAMTPVHSPTTDHSHISPSSNKRSKRVIWDETAQHLFIFDSSIPSHQTEFTIQLQKIDGKTEWFHLQKSTLQELQNIIKCKLSPCGQFLAILTSEKRIVIIRFVQQMSTEHFIYEIKNTQQPIRILGFYWVTNGNRQISTMDCQFLLITSNGMELFQQMKPSQQKPLFKVVKSISITVPFFLYNHHEQLLLIASEIQKRFSLSTVVEPFYLFPYRILDNNIQKLPKFMIEVTAQEIHTMEEHHFQLITLYDKIYLVYSSIQRQELAFYKFEHPLLFSQPFFTEQTAQDSSANSVNSSNSNTTTSPPISFVKEKVLNLFITSNQFRIHVIDNLLVIHNIEDKMSMIYDIRAKLEAPLCAPISIAPYRSRIANNENEPREEVELYGPNWIYAFPYFIIDRKLGFLFAVELSLRELPLSFRNKSELIRFLFRRSNSKSIIIEKLRNFIESGEPLSKMSKLFRLVNAYFKAHLDRKAFASQFKTSDEILSEKFTVLDMQDCYKELFCYLDEHNVVSKGKLVSLVVEYIRNLKYFGIVPMLIIQKFLVDILIQMRNYSLLHEYIQYKVISDSKQVAIQILSIHKEYPPAFQVALDMLTRLQAHDLIVETLLMQKEISHALQIMYKYAPQMTSVKSKLVFETVIQYLEQQQEKTTKKDKILFYNTFEMLQKINAKLRNGNGDFLPEEDCEKFEQVFQSWFIPKKHIKKQKQTSSSQEIHTEETTSSSETAPIPNDLLL